MKKLMAVIFLLLLCGCGGEKGGNGVAMPDDEIIQLALDPRVMRLGGIVERTESFLIPGVHVRYSVSVLNETNTDSLVQEISCSGVTCTDNSGLITLDLSASTITGLIDPDIDLSVSEANLQSRDDGFDTASIRGDLDASDIGVVLPDITLDKIPEVLGYGIWGKHGMAGLTLADGPFFGRVTDIPFSGDMEVAMPFAFGDVSGTNPDGVGSAAWTGVAEIVALRTFRRQEGTATLTITDLTQPAVSVGINDVSGNPIGKPEWMDMLLVDGHFVVGATADNYLEGNFHGVDHSEAYGVFDTDNFTGAFGVKREAKSE